MILGSTIWSYIKQHDFSESNENETSTDAAAGIETTHTIRSGDTFHGTLSDLNDVDYIELDLERGGAHGVRPHNAHIKVRSQYHTEVVVCAMCGPDSVCAFAFKVGCCLNKN